MSIFRSWYSHYLDYQENEIKHERYKKVRGFKEQIASFEDMLIEDDYKLSNSLLRSMKIKDKNILNKQKENPLMRWKVQEYGSVLSTETYLEDMHQFIKQDKQWKIIDYTERQIAIEKDV